MKTLVTTITVLAFAPSCLLAGHAGSAKSQAAPQHETATAGANSSSRADMYYEFSLGHVLEQQYEATGQSDTAQQAIDAYKKALALSPNSSVIKERLAEIYAKSQHIREAVAEAQEALTVDPSDLDAHRLLARIYIRNLGDTSSGEIQRENQ